MYTQQGRNRIEAKRAQAAATQQMVPSGAGFTQPPYGLQPRPMAAPSAGVPQQACDLEPQQMQSAGLEPQQMHAVGFDPQQMHPAGPEMQQMQSAGPFGQTQAAPAGGNPYHGRASAGARPNASDTSTGMAKLHALGNVLSDLGKKVVVLERQVMQEAMGLEKTTQDTDGLENHCIENLNDIQQTVDGLLANPPQNGQSFN